MLAFALLPAAATRAALPPPPDAAAPADVEVDEHVAQGHRLYLLGRYQDAIAEYRRAYELRADPRFLFQIAEAYRQLGATEQALFYYERYLAGAAADAPERGAAEQRVAELESLRAAPPPPSPSAGLVAAPGAAPGPTAKHPTPLWRRWWLWTAIGVAVAAGATAAALAGRSEPGAPTTDLGDKKFF